MIKTTPIKEKRDVIKIEINLFSIGRGHQPYRSGSGQHQHRATKRNRNRQQQRRRIMREFE